MPDLVLLATEAVFGLLLAAALWMALRNRDRVAWDVTLVFLPLGALLAVQLAAQILGQVPPTVRAASVALLLAQPLFSLKLASDLRALLGWVMPAAAAAYAVSTVLVLATLGQSVGPVIVLAVVVFFATETLAASLLLREGRRRRGAARARLVIAAAATGALAVALLVAGLGSAAGVPSDTTAVASRVIALAAALGYWIAFLPPRWLRTVFQATESFRFMERLLATDPTVPSRELWEGLARASHQLTAAGSIVLIATDGRLRAVGSAGVELDGPIQIDAPGSSPADAAEGVAARLGPESVFIRPIPIDVDGQVVGFVCLVRKRPGLFDEDDAALVAALAARLATLVERREVLAEEQRLAEQLRATVDALRAANTAKSDFLASMSHELRTPLNAIIGFSDLMVAEAGDARTVSVPREWIEHIRKGGTHLVTLINDVLDLARVEAGRLDLAKGPVDLAHAVTESVAGLRPLADRKGQRIEVDVPPLEVEADQGRLRQILYNLLSNAIKYTGEGGSIRLTGRRDGDGWVHLAVSDTGVGIAPEDQALVFEEFQQVGDRTRRAAGTGLGLALTKRLVEAHGGRIELESKPGVGSTFTVVLPASHGSMAEAVLVAPSATKGSNGLNGEATPRVLVIEDDPSSLRLLQQYLAAGGYASTVAVTGEQGLALAQAQAPAAILLDVLLPGMDGWEVLRRLKSDPALRDIPVVIVTAVDERNVGLALGAVDYFVKPVEREALIARLDRHTYLRRSNGHRVCVLAIDDEPAALSMIDSTLTPLGFDVECASSGHEGLDAAMRRPPDLVICDLLMPGMDGFEVIARLHRDPATAAVPILVLTAHEVTRAERARLNGAVLDVVEKGDSAGIQLREWLERVAPLPARTEES